MAKNALQQVKDFIASGIQNFLSPPVQSQPTGGSFQYSSPKMSQFSAPAYQSAPLPQFGFDELNRSFQKFTNNIGNIGKDVQQFASKNIAPYVPFTPQATQRMRTNLQQIGATPEYQSQRSQIGNIINQYQQNPAKAYQSQLQAAPQIAMQGLSDFNTRFGSLAAQFLPSPDLGEFSPGEYGYGPGGPTVAKVAGRAADLAFIPFPGNPLYMGGMAIRNILKQGPNIPSTLKMAALIPVLRTAIRTLKEQPTTLSQLGPEAVFGAVIGSVAPSPMKGLSTTELAAARRTLSDYGFKLADFSNPELLKSKFRQTVLQLHPDIAGNTPANNQKFINFKEAFNKATSAGIQPGWSLTNIIDWINNLWIKRTKPTAPRETGLLPPGKPPVQPDIFGRVPAAAVVPPAQTSMLGVTGQGTATGIENQIALDKIYQAKMGQTAPPSPLEQVATTQQLKQQMGETPLAPITSSTGMPKQAEWIIDQIYNNESSPAEMKNYLMKEGNISEEMASHAIELRDWVAKQTHVVTYDELAQKLNQVTGGVGNQLNKAKEALIRAGTEQRNLQETGMNYNRQLILGSRIEMLKDKIATLEGVVAVPSRQATAPPVTTGKKLSGGTTITLFRGSDTSPTEINKLGYTFGHTLKSIARVYGKNVIEIKIKPQNLGEYYDRTAALLEAFPKVSETILKNVTGIEERERVTLQEISKVYGLNLPKDAVFREADQLLLPYFKSKGFDAVKYRHNDPAGAEYMIIDPAIIKSPQITDREKAFLDKQVSSIKTNKNWTVLSENNGVITYKTIMGEKVFNPDVSLALYRKYQGARDYIYGLKKGDRVNVRDSVNINGIIEKINRGAENRITSINVKPDSGNSVKVPIEKVYFGDNTIEDISHITRLYKDGFKLNDYSERDVAQIIGQDTFNRLMGKSSQPVTPIPPVKEVEDFVAPVVIPPITPVIPEISDLKLLEKFTDRKPLTVIEKDTVRNLVAKILDISPKEFDKESKEGQRKLVQQALDKKKRQFEEKIPAPFQPERVQDTITQLESTIQDDLVYKDEANAQIKLNLRDQLVNQAQQAGIKITTIPLEEMRKIAEEISAGQKKIIKQAEKEVGPLLQPGISGTISINALVQSPNIQQFSDLIRRSVMSWGKLNQEPDIAMMEQKFPGLDEVVQAIRDISGRSDLEVNMPILHEIFKRFPEGTYKREVKAKPIEVTPILPPILPPEFKGGERMRGFLRNVLKSETAKETLKNKIIGEIDLYYKRLKNTTVVDTAEKLIEADREGTLIKVLNPDEPLDVTLEAAGMLLANTLQYENNFNLAKDVIDAISIKATEAGQVAQIHAIWNRLSPEGTLRYAQKTVQDAIEKTSTANQMVSSIASKIGIEKFPTKQEMDQAPQIAKDISDQLNKINVQVAEKIADEVAIKFKGKITTEMSKEEIADAILAERIIRYTKSLLPKAEKEKDPVTVMIRTLYQVARQILPAQVHIPPNELEFIADAIVDRKKYKDIWNQARDIVEEKFADNPDALELLDDYFAHYLDKPFSERQLQRAVKKGIDETGELVANIVRAFYVDRQKLFGETLATRLANEAGLTDENAQMLEKYVTDRFNQLTAEKKRQILAAMTKPIKKIDKKDFWQKIIELSNLGAFNNHKYYELIANRLNIPNISEKKASELFNLTQEMQKYPEGSVERKDLLSKVMNSISDEIPLGVFDLFDAYRYQNILSSPRTQLRNIYWNALMGGFFIPVTLISDASAQMIEHSITGAERTTFLKQIPVYYKELFGNIPLGIQKFRDAWEGKSPTENIDLQRLKFAHLQRRYPKLTVITRFMEASDQFFQTTISSALSASYQATGIDKETADIVGLSEAKEYLLRKKLDPKNKTGQGPVTSSLDRAGVALIELGKAIPPIRWVIPFIALPIQFAKLNIMYSPAAFILPWLPSTSYEYERKYHATGLVGLLAMLLGSYLAFNGDSSWETPKDEKQRNAMRDAGIPPYSLKILNWWIPMNWFGPLFPALAIPAALQYYWSDSPTVMTDSESDKGMKMVAGLARAYTNLTFLSNIGQLFAAIEGNVEVTIASYLAGVASQPLPYISFNRWLATIVDPVYRKTEDFWSAMKKNIPFVTKTLEPYLNLKGEEARRNISTMILPYNIGINNPEGYYLFRQRQKQVQYNSVINEIKKSIDIPTGIPKGSIKELEYIQQHPEVSFLRTLNSLGSKMSDLGSDEFSLYSNDIMTVDEKNNQLPMIEQQKMEVMNQVNDLYKEIQKSRGKPEVNIFDNVEAEEYAKDIRYFSNGMDVATAKMQQDSQTLFDQIKERGTLKEKYKTSRDWFDIGSKTGEKGFESARQAAKRLGLDPNEAEYDYWANQDMDIRRMYINNLIENKSGKEVFSILTQLRKESLGGADKIVLTNNVIEDMVNEQIISDSLGDYLKKIKTVAGQLQISGTGKKSKGLKISKPTVGRITVPRQKQLKIKIPKLKLRSYKYNVKLPQVSGRTSPFEMPKLLKLQMFKMPKNLMRIK